MGWYSSHRIVSFKRITHQRTSSTVTRDTWAQDSRLQMTGTQLKLVYSNKRIHGDMEI